MNYRNTYAWTQTEQNLWEAFAGETQVGNKYGFFASVTKNMVLNRLPPLFWKRRIHYGRYRGTGGLPVLRTDLHYHMFCVKCKKASDAPHSYKPHPDEEIAEQSGNKIIRHRLVFWGSVSGMPRLSAPSSSGVGIRSLFGSTGTSDTDACLCRNEKNKRENVII